MNQSSKNETEGSRLLAAPPLTEGTRLNKPVQDTSGAMAQQMKGLGEDLAADLKKIARQDDNKLDFNKQVRDTAGAVQDTAGAMAQEMKALGGDLAADMTKIDVARQDDDKLDLSSLFENASSALFVSVMIYAISEIRMIIREHEDEIQGDPLQVQEFMELPCTDSTARVIIRDNIHLLDKYLNKSDLEMFISAVQKYGKEDQWQALLETKNPSQRRKRDSIYKPLEIAEHTVIHVVDDTHSANELVYGISVDRTKRRIMITFRGSVTVRDWLVNGQLYMTFTSNPLKQATSVTIPQSKNVGMHSGFHSYLFGCKSKRADVKSKYDQILDHVRSLLETYDGFSIMVSGHSLGGALATLCTFRMALEDDISKPITCITFASPRTGNAAFCRAFQELELQQKIVCLRVANKNDIITKHPDRLNICTFFCQDIIFRHVGLELKLYPDTKKQSKRTYKLKHVRVRRSRLSQLSDDFFRSFPNTARSYLRCTFGCCIEDYFQLHSCDEYMTRLQRAANSLLEISLDDEYTSYHQALRKASVYRSVM